MIGFFEHQYLSYKKSHLHNLIALAKSDGHLHEDEEHLIYKIGDRYGLKDRQIASLINSTKSRELHIPDTHEDKMNQMYDLLLMVHADKVVDDNEIHFCQQVAEQFGYKSDVINYMLEHFELEPPKDEEWDSMVEVSRQKYLKQ